MKKHVLRLIRPVCVFSLALVLLLLVGCGTPNPTPAADDTFTITYYEGADATDARTLSVADGKLSFVPPTREGYTFEGLFDAAEGGVPIVDAAGRLTLEITADMTLWAQWSPKTYTFVFDAAEGAFVADTDATRVHTYGTLIDIFPRPIRVGYDFVGWSDGEQLVSDAQGLPVTDKQQFTFVNYTVNTDGRVHLRAVWERRQLTVTFDYNDGSYQSQSMKLDYGETLPLSALPSLDTGAKCTKGWARMTGSSNLINEDITGITEDLTLYAVWRRYKDVTLVEYEDVRHEVRVYDDAPQDMPSPTRYGYTFDGWYTSSSFAGNPVKRLMYEISADVFYARWDALTYRVVYEGNGATEGATTEDILRSVDNAVALTANGFLKHGYAFCGWTTAADGTGRRFANGETVGYLVDEIEDGRLTLYAQWELITYTLTYDGNGATSGTVKENVTRSVLAEAALAKNTFVRTGYTFLGWNTEPDGSGRALSDGETVDYLSEAAGGALTLYAQWRPQEYTVVFDATQGTLAPEDGTERKQTYDTVIEAFPVPVREGYVFAGWLSGAKLVSDPDGMPAVGKETFSFTSYTLGSDGKVHLQASWERRCLTVTFAYVDGSDRSQSISVYYGESLPVSLFPKLDLGDREIKGWALTVGASDTVTESLSNITEDLTLYAVWRRYKDVTLVEYDDIRHEVRVYDDALQDMPSPTRYGYAFDGWYASASFAGSPTEKLMYTAAEDTYYARWDLLSYRVVYNGNGATEGATADEVIRSVETPAALTANGFLKLGYTFLGWSTSADGTGRLFSDGETVGHLAEAAGGTLTLYARWEANTYTVTLNTNYAAGKGEPYCLLVPTCSATSYPVTYDKGYTLPVPTTDTAFYRFIGYFTQPEGGEQITGNDGRALRSWNKTSDMPVYAHWEKVEADYEYIATASDLKKLNGSSGRFMLIRNITGIGNIGMISSFSGTLEGSGKTLSGWTYTQSSVGTIGLIGINNGTIRNLNIRSFIITTNDPDVTGALYAGLLCGKNNGTVERVVITASSMSVDVASYNHDANSYIYAGFICGYNTGTIRQSGVYGGCTMSAYVGTKYQHAEAYCGGVVGYCDGGALTDVFSSGGKISAEAKANVEKNWIGAETGHGAPRVRVGGVVGYTKNVTITRAVGHDNALTAKATRSCGCDTNIDWRQGSLIGFRESAILSDGYSESSDTLFGWADNTSGAAKVNTTSISLDTLPSSFRENGWEQADGVPRIVVR